MLTVLATATAAPTTMEPPKLLEYAFDKKEDNSYRYQYKVDNGNEIYEVAVLKQVPDPEDPTVLRTILVKEGAYILFDAQNVAHLMKYVADENGFRVDGDLVPKNL